MILDLWKARMWKCPICKTENQENRICVKCGFDDSLNYLYHKTIGQLPNILLQQFVKDVKKQSVMVLGENDMEKTLKKVSCIYCDNEWYVEKEKKDQVKVCPFCKKSVEIGATFRKIQRLLVEEVGITENLALEKQEILGGKVENEVKLTYKGCRELRKIIVHPENKTFEVRYRALMYKESKLVIWNGNHRETIYGNCYGY